MSWLQRRREPMSAMTKKIFKDIVHRKLRTILTILGITVGILSLSAINVASNQFKSSLAYSTNITSAPDMHIYTAPTNPDLADVLQDQPNVKTVQAEGNIVTRWAIGQDHKLLQIVGILDFQHVQINRFRLVEGSLPGPNQIVLETGARSYENVPVGGHISIQVGRAFKEVTVSGFVQTQGLPQAALVGRAYGYMAESSFEQLFNKCSLGKSLRLDKARDGNFLKGPANLDRNMASNRYIFIRARTCFQDDLVGSG